MRRYVRKPEDRPRENLVVAKYIPDAPLGELLQVARMADARAELAEAGFPSGPVLIVRWYRSRDDGPGRTEYLAVPAGEWLCFGDEYDSLTASTERSLDHWYTRTEDQP